MAGRASLAALAAAALLAACASVAPPTPPALPPGLLDVTGTALVVPTLVETDPFALSEDMRRYVERELAGEVRRKGRQRALAEALFDDRVLRLQYDASRTRSAADTFAERRGNCLSLVIMTAALARALDLEVDYRVAEIDDSVSRRGNLVVLSGHVNITLGRRLLDKGRSGDDSTLTIDFLPPAEAQGLRTRRIDEAELLTLYRNNRAAEAVAEGRLGDAFAWARWAVQAQPGHAMSINTLGVVHRLAGQPQAAAQAFRHVLALAPSNTSAMANLVGALVASGEEAEAARWRARLATLEAPARYQAKLDKLRGLDRAPALH